MVGVGIEVVVLAILLILSIGLQIEARFSAKDYLLGYDDALEEMRHSLEVVATVLQRLPEMIPQFNLVNENPLSQILQFFQQMKEKSGEASLGDMKLRDDTGRYSHGEDDQETKASGESPPE
jgi:hypothetical protein